MSEVFPKSAAALHGMFEQSLNRIKVAEDLITVLRIQTKVKRQGEEGELLSVCFAPQDMRDGYA